MKETRKDIIGIVIMVLLSALIGAAILTYYYSPIAFGGSGFTYEDELPLSTELTAKQVQADREQLIRELEGVHPYFINETDLSTYNAAKEAFALHTQTGMTVSDFQLAVSEYLVSLNDGHTHLFFSEEKKLDIDWLYCDGECRIYDGETLSQAHVTAIGGVPYEDICALCDKLFPAENRSGHELNYQSRSKGASLLEKAGVGITDSVVVTLSDGSELNVPFVETSGDYSEPHNSCEMLGDVFYVDFNTCECNSELDTIVSELKTAVANSTTKVILDARGNGGGSSNACEALLNAMGMESPGGSTLIRFSDIATKQKGYLRSTGSTLMKWDSAGKQNPAIELIVLTDRSTFSSAMMLAWWVKDGHLGLVMGNRPSNNPCQYGDAIAFQLENSKLCGNMSHKLFLRYDATKYGDDTLYPDVELKPYDDALEFALGYLDA